MLHAHVSMHELQTLVHQRVSIARGVGGLPVEGLGEGNSNATLISLSNPGVGEISSTVAA